MFCTYFSYLGTFNPLNRKLFQISADRYSTYLEVWQSTSREGETYLWCWKEGGACRRNDPLRSFTSFPPTLLLLCL